MGVLVTGILFPSGHFLPWNPIKNIQFWHQHRIFSANFVFLWKNCKLHSFFITVLGCFWFLTVFLKPRMVSTFFLLGKSRNHLVKIDGFIGKIWPKITKWMVSIKLFKVKNTMVRWWENCYSCPLFFKY